MHHKMLLMKKFFLTIIAISICLLGFSANPEGKIKINIVLKVQSDVTELQRMASSFPTKADRRMFVVNVLKQQAEETQFDLLNYLNVLETNNLVEEIRPLWIVNAVSCYADASIIEEISARDDVLDVYQVEEFKCIESEDVTIPTDEGGREIAENITKVNADQVWNLGFTGEGVLVALIDTGAKLTHADLQGRLWDGGTEYPNHGYDFYSHDNDPSDTHGHGTHVAGTIVGTGASGTQTGVAPGATIMVLKVFHGTDNITEVPMWIEAMQFAVEHGADVMNMSLGQPLPNSSVKLMLRQACDNTLAAGVVAAVCAGNSRQMQSLLPIPYNVWSPGDCPPPHLHDDQLVNPGGTSCVICVGATDFNDAIAGLSSKGPSLWTDVAEYNDYPYTSGSSTNIGLIRPDVCAPGMNIKSLDWSTTNGYCLKNGTSMATPCVTGTIALMLSKDHELTPEQIDEILESTAIPLSTHKNNDFGSGRIDALAAVNAIGDDGIDEIAAENSFLIYPIPSSNAIFVLSNKINSEYRIVNLLGETVLSGMISSDNQQIDISNLLDGIYLIKIGDSFQKIIIDK